ncbi:hypothetical protein VSS37_11510 [Candidatus Thiothrix sp. Deng01]|uniref:Membrane-anchored protein n=1 Tax=Candidatus Thiothrix phosphatis TaxID=3112415 RepID=A0ABU6CXQ7_9GAMM|nr:hypothetical protein [Candidatus Thiothrix sp. Deng01]MEB4591609.1 hypothetical protein [Candidatus Thiothrix sp. Deng01]
MNTNATTLDANMADTLINRVPHIILLYWVIKIASTTLGETGADMFSMTYDLGYGATILLFMGLFVVLLGVKLAMKRYGPVTYWLTFTATAIAGTAISDFIDRTLGLGYAAGSALLVSLLLMVLLVWYVREKSINVEYITNTPSEVFYWLAFLIANTLGTAAGDFVADQLGLGFADSAMLITGMLVVIALLHFYTKVSGTLLFWLAFVLTRPFGATFGDLLTKTHEKGGLDLGTVSSSLFFAVILVAAVYRETQLETSRKAIPELD